MNVEKRAFYDNSSYRDLFTSPSSRYDLVVKLFQEYCPAGVDKILDIGCYDGTFAMLLGESLSARAVYGVDISAANVRAALSKGCLASQYDIDSEILKCESASFQVIHVGDVIEHLYNPDNLLREIYRVLAPRGTCILTTPNLGAWPNRLALLLGYQPFSVGTSLEHDTGKLLVSNPLLLGGHIRVYTLRALRQLLLAHNLKVARILGMAMSTGDAGRMVKVFRTLERPLLGKLVYRLFPGIAWDLLFVLTKE